ncbi:hypothetical protein J6S55_02055 [Candidatus Saccharibacteria bacterium]|nr:hypothetical protein [Candidatus Saccharibacteria bacterium]
MKKKLLIVAGVVSVLVLIGLGVWVVISNNSSEEAEPEYTDGQIVGEMRDKFMVFENLDFLTMAYNIKFSTTVAEDIENYAFTASEMQYSGENNSKNGDNKVYYDATINVGDLVNYDVFTSDFTVSISDGRKYRVITKTDSLDENYTYLYVAILRDGGDEIFVDSHGDEKDLTDFLEFVKSKMGNLKIVYNKVNE